MESISFKRNKYSIIMKKKIKKEYTNGELTIVWKPEMCIHAAICVQTLPRVYNPAAKPWITIGDANTEELKAQINKCPSSALSYFMNNEDYNVSESKSFETEIEVLPNGPLLVHGQLKVIDKDGNVDVKDNTTAFCRCGASNNKPYCNGAHINNNFRD